MISRAGDPAVSVVIPTYNSHRFLVEALKELRGQTIDPAEVELIVIDDGSTDDTWAYLQQESADWPQLIVLHQENSGHPGAVRNVGLGRATGRYVFFHDADDWLEPSALRRLVAAADEHQADVAIGLIRTIGPGIDRTSRIQPSLDADLIKDGVWNSLSPAKMFRRRLIADLRLSFPDDMAQGEDQVFVATTLFAASRVITLTDDVYYFRRRRDDGGNLSGKAQTFGNKVLTASRVSRLIVDNVPVDERWRYLRRVLLRTLAPGLGHPFMNAGPAEREAGLARLQRDALPHLDEELIDRATDVARLRLSVAALGTADELASLNRWLDTSRPMAVKDGTLVYDLPPELERLLPIDRRRVRELAQGPHGVAELSRDGDEVRLSLTIDPSLRRARPDRAILEFGQRGGPGSVRVEGNLGAAGDRLEFILQPLTIARAVPGPVVWNLGCTTYRADASLTTARLAWPDQLTAGSPGWQTRTGSTTAAFARTKHDNLRLDTTSPTGLRRKLREAADRLRKPVARPS